MSQWLVGWLVFQNVNVDNYYQRVREICIETLCAWSAARVDVLTLFSSWFCSHSAELTVLMPVFGADI